MSFPFVYFLSIKVSFLLLLFIHQCLFWFWLFTNVFILDLLFIHQCLLLDVVYPLLFLSVLVVHQFLHLLFIVYPPAQCLLLVLWIHQCLLVLVVHLCLPFVIVCPQMYPFSNSLSTMSTFRKCFLFVIGYSPVSFWVIHKCLLWVYVISTVVSF